MRTQINDAGEVLRHLIKPLVGVIEAGRSGDSMKAQLYGENIARILEAAGWYREAHRVQDALS